MASERKTKNEAMRETGKQKGTHFTLNKKKWNQGEGSNFSMKNIVTNLS